MEIQKMKQQFTTWNKATSIDTFSGPVLAASAIGFAENKNLSDLEYSIFFVQDGVIVKSWQYQFNDMLSPIKHNYSIFYWKPLKDINFAGINWKDNKSLPTLNSHIIGWINETDYISVDNRIIRAPLTTVSCRLHFGYFIKSGLLFKSNYLYYPGYKKINWYNIFRWCYVNELFENQLNEDARLLPLDPDNYVSPKYLK
jgi:hypothetical protein